MASVFPTDASFHHTKHVEPIFDSRYREIPSVVRLSWPLDVSSTTKDYLLMIFAALYDPKSYGGLKFAEICAYLRSHFVNVKRKGYEVEINTRKFINFMLREGIVFSIRKPRIIEPIYILHCDRAGMDVLFPGCARAVSALNKSQPSFLKDGAEVNYLAKRGKKHPIYQRKIDEGVLPDPDYDLKEQVKTDSSAPAVSGSLMSIDQSLMNLCSDSSTSDSFLSDSALVKMDPALKDIKSSPVFKQFDVAHNLKDVLRYIDQKNLEILLSSQPTAGTEKEDVPSTRPENLQDETKSKAIASTTKPVIKKRKKKSKSSKHIPVGNENKSSQTKHSWIMDRQRSLKLGHYDPETLSPMDKESWVEFQPTDVRTLTEISLERKYMSSSISNEELEYRCMSLMPTALNPIQKETPKLAFDSLDLAKNMGSSTDSDIEKNSKLSQSVSTTELISLLQLFKKKIQEAPSALETVRIYSHYKRFMEGEIVPYVLSTNVSRTSTCPVAADSQRVLKFLNKFVKAPPRYLLPHPKDESTQGDNIIPGDQLIPVPLPSIRSTF